MLENIIISNREKLENLKKKISEEGAEKIHVISDFDKTLSKNFINGKEVPSVISILRNGNYLTSDYAEKAHTLFNKYHPIEIDPSIPLQEKKKAMHNWWMNHFKLLIKCKLNKKDIENVTKSKYIKLRQGALEFFDLLHEYKIPLVIMSSAGLGYESISMILKRENRLYGNIYIISNSFKWDKNGNLISVKEPIIHSMNKDETVVHDYPNIFKRIKNRKNVLLLGDTLEDIEMIKGFDYNNIIKIGFLNKNIKENLEYFKKNYDVVILNDGSMSYVNKLLKDFLK